MKRFLVFAYDIYYPSGGWRDYRGQADTLEDALVIAANTSDDSWHIIDTQTLMIVKSGERID